MKKSEIAIVRGVFDDGIGKLMTQKQYVFCEFYKKQSSFIMRSARRIWHKLKLPFKSVWYDKKILHCDVDKIVVIDALCSIEYLKWLRKHKPNARIVFWYWNSNLYFSLKEK